MLKEGIITPQKGYLNSISDTIEKAILSVISEDIDRFKSKTRHYNLYRLSTFRNKKYQIVIAINNMLNVPEFNNYNKSFRIFFKDKMPGNLEGCCYTKTGKIYVSSSLLFHSSYVDVDEYTVDVKNIMDIIHHELVHRIQSKRGLKHQTGYVSPTKSYSEYYGQHHESMAQAYTVAKQLSELPINKKDILAYITKPSRFNQLVKGKQFQPYKDMKDMVRHHILNFSDNEFAKKRFLRYLYAYIQKLQTYK